MSFNPNKGRLIEEQTGFKFVSTAMIDFSHIYGEIVYIFRNLIKDDLAKVIDIKHEHTNTRIAIRKRLMKSSKDRLTKQKPILDINTSLNGDYGDDIFSPLVFNTDMSHIVSIDNVSDKFIRTFDETDAKKNLEVNFTFKRVSLNIEANIIDDFRQKLLNLYQYWKSIRYPERLYRRNVIISFPIPADVYVEYTKSHELDPTDKYSVYKHIKNRSYLPIVFKKNLSTGNNEIFIQYETFMDFTPKINNLSEGEPKGNTKVNYRLTRGFDVVVAVPSVCYLKMNRERLRRVMRESELYSMYPMLEDVDDGYEYEIDTTISGWEPYDWHEVEKDYQMIVESVYEFDTPEEVIDCKELLDEEFEEFYNFINDDPELLVSDYFKIKYYKNEELNTEKTYIVDEENLLIDEKEADTTARYDVTLFVKLDAFNEWYDDRKDTLEENSNTDSLEGDERPYY